MASSGRWREDQVLVICPGSQTTLAQLGCAELTIPQHRFPTRVFPDEEHEDGKGMEKGKGKSRYRPVRTFRRRIGGAEDRKEGGIVAKSGEDQEKDQNQEKEDVNEDEWEWVEDPDSVKGAIYPMVGEFSHD